MAPGRVSTAALEVESVTKRFRVERDPATTLRESLARWLAGRNGATRTVWALREVSFRLERGRSLGVIGHNGAGKSTLLRLLCGIGLPTSGRVQRAGPVSGLLELGSGFHPDLTGRENILTAAILNGLTREEVRRRERDIVTFAELEEFVDLPVRTYSSGMYLRLAFAVATEFDPATLVLDEVLAVGDARFQQKCLDRIASFRRAGNSLVLASHSAEQIRSLCDEVLVLEEGRVAMQAEPEAALRCYADLMRRRTERRTAALYGEAPPPPPAAGDGSRQGTQEAAIEAVRLADPDGRPLDGLPSRGRLVVELDYRLARPLPDLALSLGIYSQAQVKCFEVCIPSTGAAFGGLPPAGTLRCELPELPLLAGRYFLNVGLYPPDFDFVYDYHWEMHSFVVRETAPARGDVSGVLSLEPLWSVRPARGPR